MNPEYDFNNYSLRTDVWPTLLFFAVVGVGISVGIGYCLYHIVLSLV